MSASLALVPLAIYCLDVALQKRSPLYYGLTSLSFIAVVYMNWLGAIALLAMVFCYLAAFQRFTMWLATAALGTASYLVAMPWIPPSLLNTIRFNARTSGADFSHAYRSLLMTAPIGLLCLAAIGVSMHRLRTPRYLRMTILFACVTGGVALGYCWTGKAVLPQANRYVLEFDLGIVLSLAMAAGLALERAPRIAARSAVALLFLFCSSQIYRAHLYARREIHPLDIETTVEYRSARWFDQHMRGV